MDLPTLLAALKRADRGSNALDAQLDVLLVPLRRSEIEKHLNAAQTKVVVTYRDDDATRTSTYYADDITSRVDAALRLLKEVLPGCRAVLDTDRFDQYGPFATIITPDHVCDSVGNAPTLPLALCIAIVEAKIAQLAEAAT